MMPFVLAILTFRGVRFMSVGMIATVLDGALFLALAELGTDPGTSNVVSYSLSAVVNFLLNREWTFAARDGAIVAQAVRFTLMVLLGLLVSTFVVAELSLFIAPVIAKIVAIGVVLPMNYAVSGLLVFHHAPRLSKAGAERDRSSKIE